MCSKIALGEAKSTFVGRARREQLIDATIEAVAEEGYANTSLAKVAKRAEISKSVVVYHFGDKNELMEATVTRIYQGIWDYVGPAFDAEETAIGQLKAFIVSEFAYMEQHRDRLLALSDILVNHRDSDGALYLRQQAENDFLENIGKMLRLGQESGEFRSFAVKPMAAMLMHAINGALGQWAVDPQLSIAEYAEELSITFDLATRHRNET